MPPSEADLTNEKVSELVRDLMTLPGIIGNLGLSVAEAQHVFNVSYLQTLQGVMTIFEQTLKMPKEMQLSDADKKAKEDAEAKLSDADKRAQEAERKAQAEASANRVALLTTILNEVAPPRYQFTETTLEFSADLAQSRDMVISGGLSAGYGGIALSVSGSYGSSTDYRAAARIKSTLHAVPSSKGVMDKLLGQAKSLGNTDEPVAQKLGRVRGVNLDLLKEVTQIRQQLGDDRAKALLAAIKTEKDKRLKEST